jgi:hypothetical protein
MFECFSELRSGEELSNSCGGDSGGSVEVAGGGVGSSVRMAGVGKVAAASNSPFFLVARMIVQLRQSFDRKAIRTAVRRLNLQGNLSSMPSSSSPSSSSSSSSSPSSSSSWSSHSTQKYHPLALRLTSNTSFSGDANASIKM